MGTLIRRRVIVRGEVQGVYFRESTRQEADRRSVAGFARNRADGAVEAVFEGEPDAVEAMIDLVRRGPAAARVEDIELSDEAPQGLSGFETR